MAALSGGQLTGHEEEESSNQKEEGGGGRDTERAGRKKTTQVENAQEESDVVTRAGIGSPIDPPCCTASFFASLVLDSTSNYLPQDLRAPRPPLGAIGSSLLARL